MRLSSCAGPALMRPAAWLGKLVLDADLITMHVVPRRDRSSGESLYYVVHGRDQYTSFAYYCRTLPTALGISHAIR